MLVLALDDAGDSATGEKYESPPRVLGDGIAKEVWRLSGGIGIGNRGGPDRTIVAKESWLLPVVDLERRLTEEEFRGILEAGPG